MRFTLFPLAVILSAAISFAAPCDLTGYKSQQGLQAESSADGVRLSWQGERGNQLRAILGIDNGQPVIRELAVRATGDWVTLANNLVPEFEVVSGRRRISHQQIEPMTKLKWQLTPEVIDREKWNVFWDAPLSVPGIKGVNPDLPRSPGEVRRARAAYKADSCQVKTDGARIEVVFPGLSMGIFEGRLQFTVYKGSNLLRQEAIARTAEPSVAYKYDGGVRGFRTQTSRRVIWKDIARAWQRYEFGGVNNEGPVPLRARNRLAVVENDRGSIAVFPPPHKFFFAREIELNLGYVYYRQDENGVFAVGVRQAEHEEPYRPYGWSDEVWNRRANQSRRFAQANFALYNAPAGTWQRMPVYYYLSATDGRATHQAALAYTHDDRYKPVPGYKVAVSHFHTHFNELLSDAGSIDVQPTWLPVFRELGINIAMMSDFHGDGHPKDPTDLRYAEQKVYFDGCRRHSDSDFLIMPGEEPDAQFGGHYTTVFPKPVYWTHVRAEGKPLTEQHSKYGKAYRVGSPADELEMLKQEGGLMWQAHPRTKGSTGWPDAAREQDHFRSDRFLGASYQSLPVDLSEPRICEKRCFGTLDDMNNWAGPKYLIAEGDTYQKYPDDETYPHLQVNYVKLDRLPRFDEDWTPILRSMRNGDFFVTSGEILIPRFAVEGSGAQRKIVADVEWTFPLEFVEVVWGDGDKTDRQVVSATNLAPFGTNKFQIPFDASGKKWVRFAAWDSAGNGAFVQPVHLK